MIPSVHPSLDDTKNLGYTLEGNSKVYLCFKFITNLKICDDHIV